MKIISWNINSIRIRMQLLSDLIQKENPDIICLQETKVEDHLFPLDEIKQMGYDYISFRGEKSYNGVAILSKIKFELLNYLEPVSKADKRHLVVKLENDIILHNFYIPAGGDIANPSLNPKFAHKLSFIEEITDYFKNTYDKNDKIIILGDFNVAPLEHDVWSHKQLIDVVSHTPVEVDLLNKLQKSLNFVDSHRQFVDEKQKLYSWWSYRASDWLKSNRGRRLDHIWLTPNLKSLLKSSHILKEARGWDRPSDHVPIVTITN